MGYVSSEDVRQAKQMDLLTYLQNYESKELVRISSGVYCTREHDSLKISNGKWCWFSHGIGGRTALDYLIKVKEYQFVEAVETILGRAVEKPPVFHCQPSEKPQKLLIPELIDCTDTVTQYLKGRGIHPAIIDYCLKNRLLFETIEYHNAVFMGYDLQGNLRYGSVRGTRGAYKGELTGSDKHYSFSIPGKGETVHLFESAIDLLSYATLEFIECRNWQRDHLLSLAGVFKTKRKDVVPVALEQFLKDHPHITTLRLHLDNDETGRGAVSGIAAGLNGKYQVFDEPPTYGKDVNDQLRMKVGMRKKEDYCR